MSITRPALWCALVLLTACNSSPESISETFEGGNTASGNKEIREVIYSMYLPTDMAVIFQRSGANYDPAIPASTTDHTLYQDREQIAVMLGIYGVDNTYMKMLEQKAPAAVYYSTIRNLSDKIGLPGSIFGQASERIEAAFDDNEPLPSAIEEIYRDADQYFRMNGNDNLAALALFGGWVEAMYIGATIYENSEGNTDLAEKLLQQKFSLNSMYTLLSNYQESLSVKSYLLMLKKLRKSYETVEIRFRKEGFSVDTTRKKLHSYNTLIRYDPQTLREIVRTIGLIRTELIRTSAENQAETS
ncbi:MAG: hypothetical protein P1P82_09060 [Bacteroidales bacterium]|nr:hypothetical protein [Bacteroidales bacterium]MDT8430614.1 hypothetical protein [Bacteroidales bacterium]